MLTEKYSEGQSYLHCVFVYLKKMIGCQERNCMRRRSGGTLVKGMYEDSKTVMRCAIGTTDVRRFKLGTGVHASFSISHQCNTENGKYWI